MQINLKRFVNIDIVQSVPKQIQGARPVTVLFTPEGTAGVTGLYSSYEAVQTHFANQTATNTLAAAQTYFNNNGSWLYIVEKITSVNESNLTNIPNEYINITSITNNSYSELLSIAQARAVNESIYGINEKIFFAQTNTLPTAQNAGASVKNFAVKYTATANQNEFCQMTMPAYLSQINAYGIDTVHDYMFTLENITPNRALTDDQYGALMTANYNVDIVLANQIRNCGGNISDGTDLVNNFMRIVLHQTLTDSLIELLTQKIKGVSGVSKIYSVITKELEKYKVNGYLTSDKVWDKGNLTIERNGTIYTIIEDGTAISNGYLVTVLPFASLTDAEKAERMCPYIYIIIADQYGIRTITIDGEVL